MASETWEQDRRNILMLSNEESHKVTRESIEEALLVLMKEREYGEISVSELVKKAGISRAAYYKNYKSKEEVIQSLLKRRAMQDVEIAQEKGRQGHSGDFWKSMFEQLLPSAEVYQILCKNGLKGLLFETYNEMAMSYMNLIEKQNRYYMLFFSGAISNVLIGWVENGMKESPEEMGKILDEMIG